MNLDKRLGRGGNSGCPPNLWSKTHTLEKTTLPQQNASSPAAMNHFSLKTLPFPQENRLSSPEVNPHPPLQPARGILSGPSSARKPRAACCARKLSMTTKPSRCRDSHTVFSSLRRPYSHGSNVGIWPWVKTLNPW